MKKWFTWGVVFVVAVAVLMLMLRGEWLNVVTAVSGAAAAYEIMKRLEEDD